MFFAEIPRGGQGFQEKLPGGGPPISGYCIFINKCLKLPEGGIIFTLPPTSPPPPLCASKTIMQRV